MAGAHRVISAAVDGLRVPPIARQSQRRWDTSCPHRIASALRRVCKRARSGACGLKCCAPRWTSDTVVESGPRAVTRWPRAIAVTCFNSHRLDETGLSRWL